MEYCSFEPETDGAEDLTQQDYFSYLNLRKSGLSSGLDVKRKDELVTIRRTRRVLYRYVLDKDIETDESMEKDESSTSKDPRGKLLKRNNNNIFFDPSWKRETANYFPMVKARKKYREYKKKLLPEKQSPEKDFLNLGIVKMEELNQKNPLTVDTYDSLKLCQDVVKEVPQEKCSKNEFSHQPPTNQLVLPTPTENITLIDEKKIPYKKRKMGYFLTSQTYRLGNEKSEFEREKCVSEYSAEFKEDVGEKSDLEIKMKSSRSEEKESEQGQNSEKNIDRFKINLEKHNLLINSPEKLNNVEGQAITDSSTKFEILDEFVQDQEVGMEIEIDGRVEINSSSTTLSLSSDFNEEQERKDNKLIFNNCSGCNELSIAKNTLEEKEHILSNQEIITKSTESFDYLADWNRGESHIKNETWRMLKNSSSSFNGEHQKHDFSSTTKQTNLLNTTSDHQINSHDKIRHNNENLKEAPDKMDTRDHSVVITQDDSKINNDMKILKNSCGNMEAFKKTENLRIETKSGDPNDEEHISCDFKRKAGRHCVESNKINHNLDLRKHSLVPCHAEEKMNDIHKIVKHCQRYIEKNEKTTEDLGSKKQSLKPSSDEQMKYELWRNQKNTAQHCEEHTTKYNLNAKEHSRMWTGDDSQKRVNLFQKYIEKMQKEYCIKSNDIWNDTQNINFDQKFVRTEYDQGEKTNYFQKQESNNWVHEEKPEKFMRSSRTKESHSEHNDDAKGIRYDTRNTVEHSLKNSKHNNQKINDKLDIRKNSLKSVSNEVESTNDSGKKIKLSLERWMEVFSVFDERCSNGESEKKIQSQNHHNEENQEKYDILSVIKNSLQPSDYETTMSNDIEKTLKPIEDNNEDNKKTDKHKYSVEHEKYISISEKKMKLLPESSNKTRQNIHLAAPDVSEQINCVDNRIVGFSPGVSVEETFTDTDLDENQIKDEIIKVSQAINNRTSNDELVRHISKCCNLEVKQQTNNIPNVVRAKNEEQVEVEGCNGGPQKSDILDLTRETQLPMENSTVDIEKCSLLMGNGVTDNTLNSPNNEMQPMRIRKELQIDNFSIPDLFLHTVTGVQTELSKEFSLEPLSNINKKANNKKEMENQCMLKMEKELQDVHLANKNKSREVVLPHPIHEIDHQDCIIPKVIRIERSPDKEIRVKNELPKTLFSGTTQNLSEFVQKKAEPLDDSFWKSDLKMEIKDEVDQGIGAHQMEVVHYKPTTFKVPIRKIINPLNSCQRKYCKFCNVGYLNDIYLKKHMQRCKMNPVNIKIEPIGIFYCKYCNFGITDEVFFKQHQEKCKKTIDFCSSPEVKEEAKKVKGKRFKRYKCPGCEYRTNNIGHMNIHKRIHDKIPLCVCVVCQKGFSRLDALKIHMYRHIDIAEEIIEVENVKTRHNNTKSTLKMKIKNKVFKITKYSCSRCNYCTPIAECMEKHFTTIHLNLFCFRCEICGFTTKLKNNLKQHLNWHLREKTYKCSYCPYETINKSYIKKHENQVHLKAVTFKCEYCDFITYRKENVKAHMNNVRLKEKKYPCEKCNYVSYVQSNLINHVRSVHEGIKRKKK